MKYSFIFVLIIAFFWTLHSHRGNAEGIKSKLKITKQDRSKEGNQKEDFLISPRNLKTEGSNQRCAFFTKSHKISFIRKNNELQRIELEFEGKKSLINMSYGKNNYKALYAHDLDNGESVTLEYSGLIQTKKSSGKAVISISDDTGNCKTSFEFLI